MKQYRETPRKPEMLPSARPGQVDTSPLRRVAVERGPSRKGQLKTGEPGFRHNTRLGEEEVSLRRGVQSRFHAQGDRRCRGNRETQQ